jgi:hypothetical protein
MPETPPPGGSETKTWEQKIKDKNDERPKPTFQLVYRPEGTIVQEVHTQEAQERNARINREVEQIRARREADRQRIKDDFDRTH